MFNRKYREASKDLRRKRRTVDNSMARSSHRTKTKYCYSTKGAKVYIGEDAVSFRRREPTHGKVITAGLVQDKVFIYYEINAHREKMPATCLIPLNKALEVSKLAHEESKCRLRKEFEEGGEHAKQLLGQLQPQLKQLEKYPFVRYVSMRDGELEVGLKETVAYPSSDLLYQDGYYDSDAGIVIPESYIRFWLFYNGNVVYNIGSPKTTKQGLWGEQFHPHIANHGTPCWGGTGGVISYALEEEDLLTFVEAVWNFLQWYNPEDSAGAYYQNWDNASGHDWEDVVVRDVECDLCGDYVASGTLTMTAYEEEVCESCLENHVLLESGQNGEGYYHMDDCVYIGSVNEWYHGDSPDIVTARCADNVYEHVLKKDAFYCNACEEWYSSNYYVQYESSISGDTICEECAEHVGNPDPAEFEGGDAKIVSALNEMFDEDFAYADGEQDYSNWYCYNRDLSWLDDYYPCTDEAVAEVERIYNEVEEEENESENHATA